MSYWAKMVAPNLGLLFNKQIYKEPEIIARLQIDNDELLIRDSDKVSEFDQFYRDLYAKDISDYETEYIAGSNANITLKTLYPGLLTGSGYSHDTKAKGDFKIGFFFDHTTGLPVVPGSSVKGVLRNIFELDVNGQGNNYTGEKSTEAVRFFFGQSLYAGTKLANENKDIITTIINDINPAYLEEIKRQIFGGVARKGSDIFFDSVIATNKGNFLANDYITPHLEALKNPQPLQFLKVLPEIIFNFRFYLTDTGWPKPVKQLLFRYILLTNGVGAKTNVGYGQFTEAEIRQVIKQQGYELPSQVSYATSLVKGSLLKATVKEVKPGAQYEVQVALNNNNLPGLYTITTQQFKLEIKQEIVVEVKGITKGKIQSVKIWTNDK